MYAHNTGLHGQVQQLEAELERVKHESDLKIRSLRQQHEKALNPNNTLVHVYAHTCTQAN
jgi:hypothetical protein